MQCQCTLRVQRAVVAWCQAWPLFATILNEQHLRQVLRRYVNYYHRSRTHLMTAHDLEVDWYLTRTTAQQAAQVGNPTVLHGLGHIEVER